MFPKDLYYYISLFADLETAWTMSLVRKTHRSKTLAGYMPYELLYYFEHEKVHPFWYISDFTYKMIRLKSTHSNKTKREIFTIIVYSTLWDKYTFTLSCRIGGDLDLHPFILLIEMYRLGLISVGKYDPQKGYKLYEDDEPSNKLTYIEIPIGIGGDTDIERRDRFTEELTKISFIYDGYLSFIRKSITYKNCLVVQYHFPDGGCKKQVIESPEIFNYDTVIQCYSKIAAIHSITYKRLDINKLLTHYG